MGEKVFKPPYDNCRSWKNGVFLSNAADTCNAGSGAVACYANAIIGAITAEAQQYILVEVEEQGPVTLDVDIEILRMGGVVGFGPAGFSGTEKTWYIGPVEDGDYHRQDIDDWFDTGIAINKAIDFLSMISGLMPATTVWQAVSVFGTISDFYTLYNTMIFYQDLESDYVQELHIEFQHQVQGPVDLPIWAGLRTTASGFVFGTASAFSFGQVVSFTVGGISPPESVVVEGPSKGLPGSGHLFYFSCPDNEEEVRFKILWDDGSDPEWTGPISPGNQAVRFHTFPSDTDTTYVIKVIAQENDGLWSKNGYTPHNITIDIDPPLKPQNVIATDSAHCDTVIVTWDPVSNAEYYTVWYEDPPDDQIISNDLYVPYFEHTPIPQNDPLFYYVVAYNQWGTNQSESDKGYPKIVPKKPDSLWADADDCFIDLGWDLDHDSEIDFYTLLRSTTTNPNDAFHIGPLEHTYFDDIPPQSGLNYYYWVTASNKCGSSQLSDMVTIDWQGNSVPMPANVDASDGLCFEVDITWESQLGNWEWRILRDGFEIGLADETQYSDTAAEAGIVYTYAVEAYNFICDSVSILSAGDTGYSLGYPAPPSDFTVSEGTFCDRVLLTWRNVPNADYYTIARYGATLESYWYDTSYVDTDINPGQNYDYKVKAYSSCGFGNYSTTETGFADVAVTQAPTNFTASQALDCEGIRLNWNGVPNAMKYSIWRDDIKTFETTDTLTYDASAQEGISYNYKVKAHSYCNESGFSNPDDGFRQYCQVTTIPTLSQWGLIALTVMSIAAGIFVLIRRSKSISVRKRGC
jgi:hypothetical protein